MTTLRISYTTASLVCVFLCAFLREVTSQHGHLYCPSRWVDGQAISLTCEIDKSSCTGVDAFADETKFQKDGTAVCNIDATGHTNCLSSVSVTPPSTPCWCRQNATHFVYQYSFTANKAQDSGSYTCTRDCFRPSTNPSGSALSITADPSCAATVAAGPCDNNPCTPGTCSVVNGAYNCSCEGTYYVGLTCKDDPCKGNPVCLDKMWPGKTAEIFAMFGHKKKDKDNENATFVKCDPVTDGDNCKQLTAGGLSGFFGGFIALSVIFIIVLALIETFLRRKFPSARAVCCLVTFVVIFKCCTRYIFPDTKDKLLDPESDNDVPVVGRSAQFPDKGGHKATGRPHNGVADEHV